MKEDMTYISNYLSKIGDRSSDYDMSYQRLNKYFELVEYYDIIEYKNKYYKYKVNIVYVKTYDTNTSLKNIIYKLY